MITPPSDEEDNNKPIKVTTGKVSKKNKRKKKFDLEEDNDDIETCKLIIYTGKLRVIINAINKYYSWKSYPSQWRC